MRVLFLSKEGDGLGVAHRLAMEGHQCFLWIKDPRYDLAGKGMVEKVGSWRSVLGKADLIISDMVGFGQLEETLKQLGKPTLSCSLVLEQAELKRGLGMQLFQIAGISLPPTYQCKTIPEAQALVKKEEWEPGWVIKPDGNKDTSKTMVVKEKELFDYALRTCVPSGTFILQKIVDGIEVSTEGWFNGRDFIRPFNHTFEEKKFLVGDLGPATGCMGNVVVGTQSNRLTRATVEKLKPFLSSIGYRGPVDINCIVTEAAAFALEISARMGYDAIEALLEGLREPIIDLFFETATGTKKEMNLTEDAMISVRLSIPPWPMAKPKESDRGKPVLGLDEQVLKHVAAADLYKEGGKYYTAGGDGVLLKATARGPRTGADIASQAQKRVYRTLDSIKVGGKQYRTDIGDRVNKDYGKLKQWGWI